MILVFERRFAAYRLSTREEVRATTDEHRSPSLPWAGPLLLFLTLIVHFFGGSVGREGVGIQIGAWAARLNSQPRWCRVGCIATGISVIFGAPLTAVVFVFEGAVSKNRKFGWKESIAIPVMAVVGDRVAQLAGLQHPSFPRYPFSAFAQLTYVDAALIFSSLIVLASLLSLVFLVLSSYVALSTRELNDRRLALVTLLFLILFATVGYLLGEKSGLPGLGTQPWATLLGSDLKSAPLPIIGAGTLFFWAVLKIIFTAGFTGLGFKGGEVTPLIAVGTLIAAAMVTETSTFFLAIGFSAVWGVSARRPLVAAALGFEYFGEAALLAGIVTWSALKLGDFLIPSRFEVIRGAWRRGLYD